MARQVNMNEKLKIGDLVRTADDKIGKVRAVMEPYCKVAVPKTKRSIEVLLYKLKDVKRLQ